MYYLYTEYELLSIITSYDEIFIFGAGFMATQIIKKIPTNLKSKIKAIIVSDIESNPNIFWGIKVVGVQEWKDKGFNNESAIIVGACSDKHDSILATIGTDKNSYLISKSWEQSIIDNNLLKNEIEQMIWRSSFHPYLESLNINIIDHCNLNCAGCDHFSSIAEKNEIDINIIAKDLERISFLLPNKIMKLRIMGGEPLLHSKLYEIIKIARKLFKNSKIEVFSNGTLVEKQRDDFWEVFRCNSASLVITEYPINCNYDYIRELCKSHNVEYKSYDDWEPVKTLYHIPLDINGNQDCVNNFMNCFMAQSCTILSRGKIYPCSVPANIHIFNKKYKMDIPLDDEDGIDIYKVNDGERILEKLCRPIPFCRFCNVKGRTWGNKWHTTNETIEEWI